MILITIISCRSCCNGDGNDYHLGVCEQCEQCHGEALTLGFDVVMMAWTDSVNVDI